MARPCAFLDWHGRNVVVHRPWMKFWVDSWLAEPTLRGAELAARGLWIDMLCLMHKASPRGYLLDSKGKAVSADTLARIAGISPMETARLLQDLEDAGTFSRNEQRVIYSRRMVEDEKLSEVRAAAGSKGGFAKAKTKPDPSKPVASSSSSSSSSSGLSQKQEDGPGGDSAPTPRPDSTPLMRAVDAYCDAVGIYPDIRRYGIHQECAAWACPASFGEQTVLDALAWGAAESKPWRVVASRIRNTAEKAGWVPNERSATAKGQPASNTASDRAKTRRAEQSRREFGEDDHSIPINRVG